MEKCGILFWRDDFKDESGCLKPTGHNDAHICKTSTGIFMEWEDDYSCNCGCWDDEDNLVEVCKTYREVDDPRLGIMEQANIVHIVPDKEQTQIDRAMLMEAMRENRPILLVGGHGAGAFWEEMLMEQLEQLPIIINTPPPPLPELMKFNPTYIDEEAFLKSRIKPPNIEWKQRMKNLMNKSFNSKPLGKTKKKYERPRI